MAETPYQIFPESACAKALDLFGKSIAGTHPYSKLDGWQIKFIEDHIIPVTGQVFFRRPENDIAYNAVIEGGVRAKDPGLLGRIFKRFATVERSQSIEVSFGADSRVLRIEWFEDRVVPEIEITENAHILRLPRTFNPEEYPPIYTVGLIKRWLAGHPAYPHHKRGILFRTHDDVKEPAMIERRVQQDGIEVGRKLFRDGHTKFLFVAPTSIGKTHVFLTLLKDQIRNNPKDGLHLVLSDSVFITRQHADELRTLNEELVKAGRKQFELVEWHSESVHETDLAALVQRAKEAGRSVVLVTTMQSFRTNFDATGRIVPSTIAGDVHKLLKTIAYDESHHTGAPWGRKILHTLVDQKDSETRFIGTTATPIHNDGDVFIPQMFDNNAFFAYLETPEQFFGRKKDIETTKKMMDLVEQLRRANMEGDVTPLRNDQVYFVPPELVTKGKGDLFIQKKVSRSAYEPESLGGYRRVLNPVFFKDVLKLILPKIVEHEAGIVKMKSIEEVNEFYELLNRYAGLNSKYQKRIAKYHADMKEGEKKAVRQGLIDGTIDFVVTVNAMDEGVDVPRLSLLVDLTDKMNPRATMQLFGRLARINPGKTHVEVVTLSEITSKSLRDSLSEFGGLFRQDHGVLINVPPVQPRRFSWKDEPLYENQADFENSRNVLSQSTIPFWLDSMKDLTKQTIEYADRHEGKLPEAVGPHRVLHNKIVLASQTPEYLNSLPVRIRERVMELPRKPSSVAELESRLNEYFKTGYEPFPWSRSPEESVKRLAKEIKEAVEQGLLDYDKLTAFARERVEDYYGEKEINVRPIHEAIKEFFEAYGVLPGQSKNIPIDKPRPTPFFEQFLSARMERSLEKNVLETKGLARELDERLWNHIDEMAQLDARLDEVPETDPFRIQNQLNVFIAVTGRAPNRYGRKRELELYDFLFKELRRKSTKNSDRINPNSWTVILESPVYLDWVTESSGRRPGGGKNGKSKQD